MLNTPVLFLIFCRPDLTKRVFEKIKDIKPKKLFIAADGPREYVKNESEVCLETRAVTKKIDWDCELYTLFRNENLGCKIAVSSAIEWFFKNVEEGIILEEDCIPDLSFFRFCDEMLKKFKIDKRVMMITGTNSRDKWMNSSQSYHFSNFGSIWGWASWRRAWNYYDVDIKFWKTDEAKKRMKKVIKNKLQYEYRKIHCDKISMQWVDTWEYQWTFARLINSGLTVVPSVNLIMNCGFNNTSRMVKTSNISNRFTKLTLHSIKFPLKNNVLIAVDREYDKHISGNSLNILKKIISHKLKKLATFFITKCKIILFKK